MSKRNCFDCANEVRDATLSGDPNARLCLLCWNGATDAERAANAPAGVVAWIRAEVVNEVGMVDPKRARNCPGWISRSAPRS